MVEAYVGCARLQLVADRARVLGGMRCPVAGRLFRFERVQLPRIEFGAWRACVTAVRDALRRDMFRKRRQSRRVLTPRLRESETKREQGVASRSVGRLAGQRAAASSSTTSGTCLVELPSALREALTEREVTELLPVQRASYALIASGGDAVVHAPTGSGKTLAFALPITARLAGERARATTKKERSAPSDAPTTPRAVVIVPSRELARQVGKEWSCFYKRKVATVFGGVPLDRTRDPRCQFDGGFLFLPYRRGMTFFDVWLGEVSLARRPRGYAAQLRRRRRRRLHRGPTASLAGVSLSLSRESSLGNSELGCFGGGLEFRELGIDDPCRKKNDAGES